ncbi:WD repeat-containing protein 96 [Chelonia mydas]|uniref:Cilia- and flagella-associated protein 43 n=1 Tax=Chelonia mydas TaxID=8469 RepID=M7BI71_CHEMY|nr:WD repeat-containing protein 96 [Chelonia mydas]
MPANFAVKVAPLYWHNCIYTGGCAIITLSVKNHTLNRNGYKRLYNAPLFFPQRWVQGFTNRNVGFVNDKTICYPCGNYILFVDIETKKKTVLKCKNGHVGAFAVNGKSQVVAFSDQKLNPVIYIYTFPGLVKRSEIKGQAQLDYSLLAFSYTGPYLASYSSVPEFALSICPVRLPAEDGSLMYNQDVFFSHPGIQDLYYGPVLPISAIAGLAGDEAETFRDGIVHFYQIKGTHYQMDNCFDVSEPIISLVFSPDYNILLVETDKGSVYVYKPSQNEKVIKLLDACNDHFLSADFLTPGNKYCVSVAISGEVHVWLLEDGAFISKLCLNTQLKRHVWFTEFFFPTYLCSICNNDECIDERGMLKNRVIQKRQYELEYPLSSAVRQKDDTVYGYCKHAPFICKYHLAKKKTWKDASVTLSEKRIPSNQFAPGFLHLSPNSQLLASVAKDGVLFIHDAVTLKKPSVEVMDEDSYLNLNILSTDEMTWLNQKVQKAIKEEIKKFADKRKELKKGIKKLRKTIQEMMYENEQVPDIERLDQQDFNLDIEEQERLQVESEQEVAKVWKEIEMENLAKCYLRDVIKKECWDSMSIKGRAIKCFHAAYEVKNYPMKERSKEELEVLERVLQLKKFESADFKIRKEIVEFQPQAVPPKEEGEKVEEEPVTDEAPSNSLIGSLSAQFGGDTSILYHQMDLHTREQKINQIILLQDIIYKVKTAFNKEFDTVARQKEQEIARVKERNLRIQEIVEQLELQEEVWEPALTDDEIPERALTVQDSEIKVEKYLTPEQRAKAEMMAKIEMERRLAALNSARQRALYDMMNGVLEIKKEDILKIEIPPPPFVSKPDTLWNEEEKKVFKEFEKKVKELNEEREKYRKTLETELKKLQTSIQETTQTFDDTVSKLFERKVKSEMVIYQEELKINNLLYSLLLDEELSTREAGLNHFLDKKQKEKLSTAEAVQVARAQHDAYRETYDNLVAEDKAQGEKKIASMVESKDFSKGIFQLEWEHKKMKMLMEDLNQRARDIQKLHVSRDRQLFLSVLNYDSRITQQVSVMEQTLGVMDKLHKKNVKNRQKIFKDLEKRICLKEQANYKLSQELQEMLVSVSERRHIFEAADTQLVSEKAAKEHYRDIVQRRQLVDLAKEQAQEIAVLQAEVERLRMRTFPALFETEY